MTVETAKQELIRRYKYLYENACFILAPFMRKETIEELERRLKEQKEKYGTTFVNEQLIYLNINRLDKINLLFEEFLLSKKVMEQSELYKFIEKNRNNKNYLEQAKNGLALLEEEYKDRTSSLKTIAMLKILRKTYDYIKEQSGDLNNKKNKLNVIEEYYKIGSYQNKGEIYKNERYLKDWNQYSMTIMVIEKEPRKPTRDKTDIGIPKNSFIKAISFASRHNNWSVLSENEKQQVYLQYHDELTTNKRKKALTK